MDELARIEGVSGARVTVVVPDLTRPLDPRALLPSLLARLQGAREVTVVVALGLHRPLRPDELSGLGKIPSLLQHDAFDASGLVQIGDDLVLPGGTRIPARFSRPVVDADLRILVGTVEPHQYAGFSGGMKAVAIGCASAETITAMHGLELLRDPGVRLGAVRGNPFHAALWKLTAGLGPTLGVQLVPDRGMWVGPIDEAYGRALERAHADAFHEVDRATSAMHVRVPKEKAQSFYQASRAFTYLALAKDSSLAAGGSVVLEAECSEGLGLGAGERAFSRALERGRAALLEELEVGTRTLEGGEQRAYVLARALERNTLRLVRKGEPIGLLSALGIEQATVFDERPDVEIVDPFTQIPVLAQSS